MPPTDIVAKSGALLDLDDQPVKENPLANPKVREAVLKRSCGRCEHLDEPGFHRADGAIYRETHYIVPLHEGGPDRVDNIIALCPNDHREAHYGKAAAALRLRFIAIVAAA